MLVKEIKANDYLTKSNLPASDYVINPYIGCTHGCKYCYASFMKRFTGHKEDWGDFVDIKLCDKKINLNKISKKSVFLSSVTDCYNQLEEKYKLTRHILEQLVNSDCYLSISIIFYVFRDSITRVFYAFNDSKTPFLVALSSIVIKFILNFFFVKQLGIGGITLSTSFVTLINGFWLGLLIKKKMSMDYGVYFKNLFKMAVISIATYYVCLGAYKLWDKYF